MSEVHCPTCGRKLAVESGAAFCPFCGGALTAQTRGEESEAVRALLAKAAQQEDPNQKHELLKSAQALDPDSLAVAEEILLLGRLYERGKRGLDFSVIKSYLLMIYLEPETIPPAQIAAMRRELFDHPDLERCLALCDDRSAFLTRYLTRLCDQFISLFLHGNNQYMRRYFGFSIESRAPKLLAAPTARMLDGMEHDTELTREQRSVLTHALYAAFSTQHNGDTQWLQKEMEQRGLTLD